MESCGVLFLSLSSSSLLSPRALGSNILSSFKLPSHHVRPDLSLPLTPCAHCQYGSEAPAVVQENLDRGRGLGSAAVSDPWLWVDTADSATVSSLEGHSPETLPMPTSQNWFSVSLHSLKTLWWLSTSSWALSWHSSLSYSPLPTPLSHHTYTHTQEIKKSRWDSQNFILDFETLCT